MMKLDIILMVWQLLVLELEGLQRLLHTAVKQNAAKVDWDLCEAEVYSNLGGLGGRNEPGTDLSSGKNEIRYKSIGSASNGEPIDLVITNTTEYKPNPDNPKAAREAGDTAIGGQYFNGRKECMGVFNIKSPSEVTLKFSVVLAGTDTLAPEGIYDFTIFDFDKSKFGMEEQIVAQGMDSWVQGKVAPIIDGSRYIFSALPDGIEVENPSDPNNMTDAQMDASVGFVYSASEWEITFKAVEGWEIEDMGEAGMRKRRPPPGGRNFHFAGRSQMHEEKSEVTTPIPGPPVPPPCASTASTTVDWDVCNAQVYSNLGGLGGWNEAGTDLSSGKNEIRYDSIVKLSSGATLDLVITNTTEYLPDPENPGPARKKGDTAIGGQYYNGKKNCLGVFNIMAPGEVTLKFSMVLTGTDTLAPSGLSYDFTIFDFDASRRGLVEQIEVQGIDSWVQGRAPPIIDGDTYTFGASPDSPEVDNPSDPWDLTDAQINASVGFVYSVNEWEITFKAIDTQNVGMEDGRNFMFSGRSKMQEKCNPERPPPPPASPESPPPPPASQ